MNMMAEILSPKPTELKAPPVLTRLQSPTSPFFLGSNDDQLERAQARAARAAAVRRKYLAANAPPQPASDNCLDREQIVELLQNCIKLASENKINQKNTWELKLIDHLSEVLKVDTENDSETNFQKASCTLEASVKIYSLRVDSVHAEAYKTLGRIIRAGGEYEQGTVVEGRDSDNGPDEDCCKKEKHIERKISPLSTMEASFDAINMKKFDVAFAVDPLYHQTSAQFDEGGAKGLLLNNLGVYGGCRVLFDSSEVPKKCISHAIQDCNINTIDLSFVRDCIVQMLTNMPVQHEISPTLKEIFRQFDEDICRQSHSLREAQEFAGSDDLIGDSNVQLESSSFQNFEAGHSGNEGGIDVDAENFAFEDAAFPGHHKEDSPFTSYEPDVEGISEEFTAFLFRGSEFTKKQVAWAGPEYWKYRNPKGAEDVFELANRSDFRVKRSPSDKPAEPDINFMKALDEEMPDLFGLPKNPKLLLLPANRVPPGHTLPEDCHYQPENLVNLFLLPSVKCFGKGKSKISDDNSWEPDRTSDGQVPSWDNGGVFGGHFDDVCSHCDVEDLGQLVSHPRQVNKIDVQCHKTYKQVDVRVLKKTLWDHIQESTQAAEMVYEGMVSFKDVLAIFPDDCQTAPAKDISSHLCFICLLHLANEHNLSLYDCLTLDDLRIQLPCAQTEESSQAL